MWAFATMAITPTKDLMDGAINRFMSLLPTYNPQGIANTLWSFASLAYFPGQFFFILSYQRHADLFLLGMMEYHNECKSLCSVPSSIKQANTQAFAIPLKMVTNPCLALSLLICTLPFELLSNLRSSDPRQTSFLLSRQSV